MSRMIPQVKWYYETYVVNYKNQYLVETKERSFVSGSFPANQEAQFYALK